jgi:hypothetical protein
MDNPRAPEQRRALDEFANAAAQPLQPTRPPSGHMIAKAPSITDSTIPIGAQPVAMYRDDQRVMQKIAAEAAAASDNWYYRFPARSKDGQTWIEGPSIKLANAVARMYGNDAVETRVLDYGDSWLFLARFTDFETGFSMERAYQQRKSQTSVKTKDYERQQDLAFSVGQSKAIRNVIVNALGTLCDFAFEEARNSIVERVGKNLEDSRRRALEKIEAIALDVHRVERVMGRSTKNWLAPDIAKIVAMLRGIEDGMATVDEMFPPIEAAAPAQPAPAATQPAPAADEKSQPSAEQLS